MSMDAPVEEVRMLREYLDYLRDAVKRGDNIEVIYKVDLAWIGAQYRMAYGDEGGLIRALAIMGWDVAEMTMIEGEETLH